MWSNNCICFMIWCFLSVYRICNMFRYERMSYAHHTVQGTQYTHFRYVSAVMANIGFKSQYPIAYINAYRSGARRACVSVELMLMHEYDPQKLNSVNCCETNTYMVSQDLFAEEIIRRRTFDWMSLVRWWLSILLIENAKQKYSSLFSPDLSILNLTDDEQHDWLPHKTIWKLTMNQLDNNTIRRASQENSKHMILSIYVVWPSSMVLTVECRL